MSRGAAFGDFDNDGDQDIVISNLNGRPSLLLNQGGNRRNWILLRLLGRKSNRFGLGARIKLSAGSLTQYWTVSSASSYQSANDPRIHFGLGDAERIESVEIQWPSGIQQTLRNVLPNQILDVAEPEE